MQRYFIRISYKGTRYHGWQVQNNANSVQAELEKALSVVFEENIEITGCGRTDTGVHARDYYAHFDSEQDYLDKVDRVFKLNKFLPHDIAVKQIIKVKQSSHARFDATYRTYRYYIAKTKDPFLIDTAYYFYGSLDVEKMNEAAQILFNFIDFSCFSKSNTQVKTNNCKILLAHWEETDQLLVFTIKADRFLRNMVRAIVGTLIDVGKKRISLEDFIKIIEGKNRSSAGYSVPANGLFLEEVGYPKEVLNG
jgi:tRNA pseudouridine38-40 synthase